MTVVLILLVASFVLAAVSAMGKCPLWISVILLCLIELIEHMPLGK